MILMFTHRFNREYLVKNTSITLEIPEDVLQAMKFPPQEIEQELCKELALALYRRGVLGIGPARRLAGLTRWEFEELLGDYQISRHYTASDLAEDIGFLYAKISSNFLIQRPHPTV